ncbi:tape measure protein [Cytobacillus sp.]|uniref:tape measure protein n=1 Tax=Cytobacillus sp. TaxID=2675269 RepID=UPI0028BF50BE|nr:tape measure protein [Cytobacillus sp.]
MSVLKGFSNHLRIIDSFSQDIGKVWNSMNATMSYADNITSVNTRLSFINDGLRTQAQLQQQVLDIANRTASSYQSTAGFVSALGAATKGVFKNNDDMLAFTESFNKTLDIGGADKGTKDNVSQLMIQALGNGKMQDSGFREMSKSAPAIMDVLSAGLSISETELQKLGEEGKLTADMIVKAFENQSTVIDGMFSHMPLTFAGATDIMKNKFAEFIGNLNQAGGPLSLITEQMQGFIAWLSSANGEQFFSGLAMGIDLVVRGFVFLTDVIGRVLNFVLTYLPEISAMLLTWGATLIPSIIVRLWGMVQPILMQAMAWLAANWPILLIVAAVGLLVFIIRQFGVTTDQIIGFVAGVFTTLFALIYNGIANIWNFFAMLAEFLINRFIDPVYAVKKLFYDLVKMAMNNLAALTGSFDMAADILGKVFVSGANIAIGGINALIRALNKIPGVDIQEVKKFESGASTRLSDKLKNFVNNLEEPKSDKNIVNIPRMDLKSVPESFQKGYKSGSGFAKNLGKFDGLESFAGNNFFKDKPGMPGGNNFTNMNNGSTGFSNMNNGGNQFANIDKVGEVGKINDTVDISSEDIKTMRELAEMKSIQNFVSLQPSVKVEGISVREEADINTIVARIEQKLEQEFYAAAEGVYM